MKLMKTSTKTTKTLLPKRMPDNWVWVIDDTVMLKQRGFHGREKRRLLAKMQRVVDWFNNARARILAKSKQEG
jgi:hypothetical protein